MDEKLVKKMNDARFINMSEHLLYPMLAQQLEAKIDEMCAVFREGKETNHYVAQVAYIKELMVTLKQLQKAGNKELEKLNKE